MAREYTGAGAGFLNPAGYAGEGVVVPPIADLDELGDWYNYGLPGGLVGTVGAEATAWTDESASTTRTISPRIGGEGTTIRTTAAPSGDRTSESGVNQGNGYNATADSATIRTWEFGTHFIAIRYSAVPSTNHLVGISSDFTSRYCTLKARSDGAGVRLHTEVNFPRNDTDTANVAGNNVYDCNAITPLNEWTTCWLAAKGDTIRMFLNGVPSIGPITILTDANPGSWFNGQASALNSMYVQARVLKVGGNAGTSFGMVGDVGAWGIMGGTTAASALSDFDVKRGDDFIRSKLGI